MVYVPSPLFVGTGTAVDGCPCCGIHVLIAGTPAPGEVNVASFTGWPLASRILSVHVMFARSGGDGFASTSTKLNTFDSPSCDMSGEYAMSASAVSFHVG